MWHTLDQDRQNQIDGRAGRGCPFSRGVSGSGKFDDISLRMSWLQKKPALFSSHVHVAARCTLVFLRVARAAKDAQRKVARVMAAKKQRAVG